MITKLNFTDHTIKSYAIRKLTPKECFRLMGVRDNVIGTMQSSNAQAAERLPGWNGKGNPEDMAMSSGLPLPFQSDSRSAAWALLLCIVPITLSRTPIKRKHSVGVSLRMA